MPSILDKSFKYVPAADTHGNYLRNKFRRIAKELEAAKNSAGNVKPITKKVRAQ